MNKPFNNKGSWGAIMRDEESDKLEKKATNPKDALGIKKAPTHLIPTAPLYELGLAMLEGGRKYGAHNFRAMGTRASVYYDATRRHLDAWWEGEDFDPDSGIHHLMKAAACIFVMRDSMYMKNEVDDRPIKYPGGMNMYNFNRDAERIIEKYSDCVEPFIEKNKKNQEEIMVKYGPSEDMKSEKYEGFDIAYNSWSDAGWYVNNNEGKHLCKDLEFHAGTGYCEFYNECGHEPNWGEAPGYFKSKAQAKKYINNHILFKKLGLL